MENELNAHVSNAVAHTEGYKQDYLAVLPEAEAIPEADLLTAPTDVETASGAIFSKKQMLDELRADAAQLVKFDLRAYDQLQPRGRALSYAESAYRMAVQPPKPIQGKVEQAWRNKALILAQAEVLVLKAKIAPAPIETLKFNTGDRQMAANTRHVIFYLESHWEELAPHTSLTLEELHEYNMLAEELHTELVIREDQPKKIARATLVRRQMFTLVFRSLAAVERAATYFHGDKADLYIPNVFVKLGRRGERAEPESPDAPTAPVTPAPASAPATADEPIPVGMPGSNPFMR